MRSNSTYVFRPRRGSVDAFIPEESPRRPLTFKEKAKYFFTGTIYQQFTPPSPLIGKKTLILDLDETLIHSSGFKPAQNVEYLQKPFASNSGTYVFLRPGLKDFLKYCYENFDLFIFTAARQEYADFIIDSLYPLIESDHRYYRDSCFPIDGKRVKKDISILNRAPEELILIDDSYSCYMNNPKNTISIEAWNGTPDDDVLKSYVIPILERCRAAEDVREVLSTLPPPKRRRASTMIC